MTLSELATQRAPRQTDCGFLLEVLDDGGWHSTSEILRRSIDERGVGMTVHSRLHDLRRKGYVLEHRRLPGRQRGAAHEYRLLRMASEPGPQGLDAPAHRCAGAIASVNVAALFAHISQESPAEESEQVDESEQQPLFALRRPSP